MVQWWRSPVDSMVYNVDPSTVLAVAEAGWEPGRYPFGWDSTGAQAWRIQIIEELVTIAAAATTTTANTSILRANSLTWSVNIRVTVAIPTATTFLVGVSGATARFATGVPVAVNSTTAGIAQWNTANTNVNGPVQVADSGILITPSSTPANANGRVRIAVVQLVFDPPLS